MLRLARLLRGNLFLQKLLPQGLKVGFEFGGVILRLLATEFLAQVFGAPLEIHQLAVPVLQDLRLLQALLLGLLLGNSGWLAFLKQVQVLDVLQNLVRAPELALQNSRLYAILLGLLRVEEVPVKLLH